MKLKFILLFTRATLNPANIWKIPGSDIWKTAKYS